jgi:cyclophilin family peptidyl-prolyl cis-trans isomerase
MRYFSFLLCCLLSLGVILSAQEVPTPSTQIVQTEEEAAALGPKNKTFMDSTVEYKELTKKLTAMKKEYQDAKPERRKEIEADHSTLFKQGLELHKKSLALALDAHDETPNRNPAVIQLLYSTVQWEFNRENYEESMRVFKRLVASGITKGAEGHYVFAGFSALLSMNYDEAEAWLKTAEDTGELEKVIMEWAKSEKGMSLARTMQSQYVQREKTKESWNKEQAIRKAETEAGEQDPAKKLPRVELTTSKGKIILELFENEAPNTVANFISLVEKGFYNGIVFHRVLENFMAQGGDPTGTGRGGPGYAFDDECGNRFPQYRRHFRGSISMANAGPNTNGSQFFLTFVPTSMLDGRHTVFGRIVEGLEVLSDIERVDPDDKDSMIPELDKIIEAKVLNKRDHAYEVKKNGGR